MTTATEPLLSVKGLEKTYGRTKVLRGIDLRVNPGETVCLLGPNGSGKTTLLRCLNLLTEPTGGEMVFEGRKVGDWSAGRPRHFVKLNEHRSRVTMVFQHFELFPHLTAAQNIALGPRRVLRLKKADAMARAHALLGRVGLEHVAGSRPSELSGGQKQRVAIARALAMDPALVLFDEPTSALDPRTVGEVLTLMRELAEAGTTMVIVTHEMDFARNVADRAVVLEDGEVIQDDTPAEIFGPDAHPRTAAIVSGHSWQD